MITFYEITYIKNNKKHYLKIYSKLAAEKTVAMKIQMYGEEAVKVKKFIGTVLLCGVDSDCKFIEVDNEEL